MCSSAHGVSEEVLRASWNLAAGASATASLACVSTWYEDLRQDLSRVDVPTLVIHGTVDPLVRPEGGKDTAASISGAKLLMIEGMGHALPIPMWPQIIDAIDKHAHGAAAKAA